MCRPGDGDALEHHCDRDGASVEGADAALARVGRPAALRDQVLGGLGGLPGGLRHALQRPGHVDAVGAAPELALDRIDGRGEGVEQRLVAQLRAVVRDWRTAGVATVTGAAWSSTTLKRALCSARLSGQREHHGQIVADAVWPAIIAPDQTERLRALLRDPDRNRVAGVVARSYLLTGFVWCGRCEVPMTTRPTQRGKRRYVCVRDRGGCDRNGIAAEPLKKLMSEAVLLRLSYPAVYGALTAGDEPDNRAELLASLREDAASLEQLARDHFVDRVVSRDQFLAATRALEERRGQTQRALERLTAYPRWLACRRVRRH